MEYSLPIANFEENTASTNVTDFEAALNPVPGFSLGMEFVTSSHAFQIYLSTYNGIVPQANYFKNQNSFLDGFNDILIGFTITRIYNF
jgi:hypothetical protein